MERAQIRIPCQLCPTLDSHPGMSTQSSNSILCPESCLSLLQGCTITDSVTSFLQELVPSFWNLPVSGGSMCLQSHCTQGAEFKNPQSKSEAPARCHSCIPPSSLKSKQHHQLLITSFVLFLNSSGSNFL